MTVHKLNAGDGYVYLTKHVAKGDATESRKADAVDYYVAKGTPPGIWCGRLAEKVGVEIGTEVTEDAMRSVFGAARTPDAFATRPNADAPLEERLEWSRRTALGRAFSWFQKSQEYVNDVEELCSSYKAKYGEYPAPDAKKVIQLSTARKHLRRRTGEKADLLSEPQVWEFITEQYTKVRQPVAGYDLVFTPMKSVSLLWGLGDEKVKAAVEEAHAQAVSETLEWIENEVIYTRRGAGGARKIKAEGLLVARFDHYDNRASDPNLHTHCAVLNRVLGEDKWTTIDGSILYKANVAGSEKYNTRVAELVSRKLGVTFARRPDTPVGKQPVYEVDGIPLSLIEEFSRRSEIEVRQEELAREYKDRYGKNPPKKVQYAHAQQATLDTRNAKNPPRSLAELRSEWRQRAEAILAGSDPAELVEAVQGERDRRPLFSPTQVPALVEDVVDALSRKVGTWTVFSLSAEIDRQLRQFSFDNDDELRAMYDNALELALRDYCKPTFTEEYHGPERVTERIERGLVRSQLVDRAEMRYTAESVLEAEKFMREQAFADDERTVSGFVIRRQIARAEKRAGHSLGGDQIAMIEHFLTAKKHVAVAVGAAGAGKTTAATVIARAWETSYGKVVALGPSARAAEVLGEEISVQGRTIADVLTRHRVGLPTGIDKGDLLLVDEAGMASARDLADLTRIAVETGAVVRLLGDPQQLASVEAGGVLRDLADLTGAPFLEKVHRFTTDGEAEASLRLRSGDASVLSWYAGNDRIREGMAHELPDLVFDAYVRDVEAGEVALMVAPTNDLVRQLNEKAAVYYRTGGTVTGPGIVLADGLEAAVGDVVVTRKNNSKYVVKHSDGTKSGRVKNGDLWTVTAIGDDGSLRLRNHISDGEVTVAADYIAENVQLGYATTVHRSQGMTVGHCHVLAAANMDRQSLYVALSRGKHANIVYAAGDELPDWDFEHPQQDHPGATGLLARIIERDGSQRTAHQMIEDAQRQAASWSRITDIYELAVSALYDDYTEKLLSSILTERQLGWVHDFGGWDAVVTCVTQAETFGWDTKALLRGAAEELREQGRAGQVDDGKNAPGRILARALRTRIAPEDGPGLPRTRRDDLARYKVPALTDAAAERDPILAAYARAQQQQMHAFIDSYLTRAIEQNAPWVAAVGTPGDDPRRVRLWEKTVREIAISRVTSNAPDDQHDPLAYLRGARREKIESAIERLAATPAGHRKSAQPSSPYAGYSDTELFAARQSSRRRLGEDRHLLTLTEDEFARVSGTDSAVTAVDERVAEVERQDRHIQAVRASRAWLERLRTDPAATAEQIAAARAALSVAEQTAPPERDWPIIERSAQFNRAAAARRDRAQVLDEQAIGRVRDRITRLEEGLHNEQAILEQIDAEIARREREGTPPGTRRTRPQASTPPPTSTHPELDRTQSESGPEVQW
ncbi:conjugal transfer protein TraA [Rhodococcus ruber Chol-4]|uniref:MobF family relaxase n=3 Tax=Rhodococcus TaxID=1827 RepID=A0ABU7LKM8_9NOCA|nr:MULTISPECIES: MobF family relaxase [Rhodococcus]KXF84377.1 conjugal transfer protein TraA [Rhodococcus ruber Chol-4]MEE2062109.1 MobF family relaxase [Rhodococcus artemisiae]